jgi:anhydro-N-acetylmuramic acid kinase
VIAALTGRPVASDLRSADLALGGQGAPLVPVGDKLLFPAYDACLNIGGFSNVSMDWQGKRIAFDICPSNIILNRLASYLGHDYDKEGIIASKGKLIKPLFDKLNNLPYYVEDPPKSLGREWLEEFFLPILSEEKTGTEDLLRTVTEHIGYQIGQALHMFQPGNILVTGGGAYNAFLLACVSKNSHHNFIIPENLIVDYKEAVVFAFLGTLRVTGRINVFASVTGAGRDHSGGAVYDLFPE